jgi:15-cis-phytoene synthase
MSVDQCHAILARRSLSFRLAARLLPPAVRDDAAVIYAWCRRCDDAVDERPAEEHAGALRELRDELAAIYAGRRVDDPIAAAFAEVVWRRGLPRAYAAELLEGMAMDARGERYQSLDDLLVYCFRVAGTVGLMMAHLLGVTARDALRRAAHLGMAMQLTNVCRDVVEDWERGRLYVPAELLPPGIAPGGPLPDRATLAPAIGRLLAEADRFYRSGDRGLWALPWRAALAVSVARRLYAAIGRRIARRGNDVLAGRAFVPAAEKLLHVVRAALAACASLPRRLSPRPATALLPAPTRFPDDVLPL